MKRVNVKNRTIEKTYRVILETENTHLPDLAISNAYAIFFQLIFQLVQLPIRKIVYEDVIHADLEEQESE